MLACPTCRRGFDEDSRYCAFDGDRLRRPTGDRVGAMLGEHLRLDAVIGQGAMGVVFRGHQLGVDRPVAVKLLHPELAGQPELRARFFREARAGARVAGPHVAAVHLMGESDDGVPYIAMDLVAGESLAAIAAGGPLPAARVAELGRQIALALADAHDAGVIHRDLTPANVMVARRRGVEHAVVLDFGIAKLEVPGAGATTRVGEIFGTPSYLAPEQAEGHAVPQSDLYSLGVILHQLWSGRPPFAGGGVEVIVAHLLRPPPPLHPVDDDERALARLILRCLAKTPGARPASAAALADELAVIAARLAAVDPTPADDEVERAPRPRGSRPGRAVGAAAGVTVILAMLLALASPGAGTGAGRDGAAGPAALATPAAEVAPLLRCVDPVPAAAAVAPARAPDDHLLWCGAPRPAASPSI